MRAVVALIFLSAVCAAPAGPAEPTAAPAEPQDGPAPPPAASPTRMPPPVTVSPNPYVEMADKFIEELLLQSADPEHPKEEGDTPPRVAPSTQSPEEVFDRLMNEVFSKTTTPRPAPPAQQEVPAVPATGDRIGQGPDEAGDAAPQTTPLEDAEVSSPATAAPSAPPAPKAPSKNSCECPPSVHNPENAPCECMRFSECAGPKPKPTKSGKPDFPGPIPGDTCPGFFTVCCVRGSPGAPAKRARHVRQAADLPSGAGDRPATTEAPAAAASLPAADPAAAAADPAAPAASLPAADPATAVTDASQVTSAAAGPLDASPAAAVTDAPQEDPSTAAPPPGAPAVTDAPQGAPAVSEPINTFSAEAAPEVAAAQGSEAGPVPPAPALVADEQKNSSALIRCDCPPSVENPDKAPCHCMPFDQCLGAPEGGDDIPDFPGPIPGDTCPGFFTVCCVASNKPAAARKARQAAQTRQDGQVDQQLIEQVFGKPQTDDGAEPPRPQAEQETELIVPPVPEESSAIDTPLGPEPGPELEANSTARTPCDCPPSVENPNSVACLCMHYKECSGPEVPVGEDGLPEFPGPIPGDTCPGFFNVCCVPPELDVASLVRKGAGAPAPPAPPAPLGKL